jgi:hypothetical protein
MNKNLWGIVKETKKISVEPNKSLEGKSYRDEKVKAIILISLSKSELYHLDPENHLRKYGMI